MTRVVCRPLYWFIHLITMATCTSYLLSRSSNCCSQHFCGVCKYMFRIDWSNKHNDSCSNHVFKVFAFCHHCSTVHEVPHRLGSTILCLSNSSLCNTSKHDLLIIILRQSTSRAPFSKVTMIYMTTIIVQIATLLTMTAIVCVIPVTAISPPPFSKVVPVPMEIQRSSSMDWADISSTKIGRAHVWTPVT